MLDKIKTLCKEQHISISKLEKQLGFGNGVIGRWDKSVPSYDRLSAVANALGVSVEYLTGEQDAKKDPAQKGEVEALVADLPENIRQLIRICMDRPDLARALLSVAQQIENDPSDRG